MKEKIKYPFIKKNYKEEKTTSMNEVINYLNNNQKIHKKTADIIMDLFNWVSHLRKWLLVLTLMLAITLMIAIIGVWT